MLCRQLPAYKELGKAGGEPQHWGRAAHCFPPYLFKCISCNRLESLFHVNGLLGTGFKVGDVVFTVAPGLCSFCGDLGGQRTASLPSATQQGVLSSGQGQRSNLSSSDLKATALKQNTGDHNSSPDRPSPRARRPQSTGLLP